MDNIKLIKSDNNYRLELWGASTKHPDVVFDMENDIKEGRFCLCPYEESKEWNLYQWVLYCASRTMWRTTAIQLVEYANTLLN